MTGAERDLRRHEEARRHGPGEAPPWASANAPAAARAGGTMDGGHRPGPWAPCAIAFLAAVWLLVSSVLLAGASPTARGVNDAIVGIVVAAMAVWIALAHHRANRAEDERA